ncbi:LLM class flavin-dependent oxidoreductase [Mycobacterium sp. 1245805.9]|uniref:LLM class flavin-dependent oxidoreductase n=1 Tax=Mycobacterium sp. 1245805.9 TaxID=1856862 RepID=UPI000A7E04C1
MADAVVDAARKALGPLGVCLPVSFTTTPSPKALRESVRRFERAGYGAVWTNEVIGKDALVQLAMLLADTERMVFGTCIANIWARPRQTMHAAAAQLAQAFPGRFVLGIGVGYPEQAASVGREFGRPLSTMRDYLEGMNAATWPPAPDAPYARIVAANGPKMLALAGDLADGALPAGLPPGFTAQARSALGPDKLVVVGLSVVRDVDEVSDQLVNSSVAQGDPANVADNIREHLAAGADHVTLLPPVGGEFDVLIEQLERLGPALAGLGE